MNNKMVLCMGGMFGLAAICGQAAAASFQGSMDVYDMANTHVGAAALTGTIDIDTMTMSVDPFVYLGLPGTFTRIDLYGAGSYSFYVDSQVPPGYSDPTSPGYLNMSVGAGQIGAFALIDWNTTTDLGAVFVWDLAYAGTVESPRLTLSATDPDGDGVLGTPQIDGPFIGVSAAINLTTVPLPAAAWLLGSGALGLIGAIRLRSRV